MIKIHCDKLSEFVRLYVLDWQVLSALAIPTVFSVVFPAYWLLLCPRIWAQNPELFRPRAWLIAYWLFAASVWFVFLAICFYRTRSSSSQQQKQLGCRRSPSFKSGSTEDLWSEDRYIADPYLPSPDYKVSIGPVQPPGEVEERQEMDETWDYNFEEARMRVPFQQQHYHSLGMLLRDDKRPTWRKYSEPNDLYNASELSTDDEAATDSSVRPSSRRHVQNLRPFPRPYGRPRPGRYAGRHGTQNWSSSTTASAEALSSEQSVPLLQKKRRSPPDCPRSSAAVARHLPLRKDNLVTRQQGCDLGMRRKGERGVEDTSAMSKEEIRSLHENLAVELEKDFYSDSEEPKCTAGSADKKKSDKKT